MAPTTVYQEGKVNRTIDGIQVELVPAIGETDDQILIWLPDSKMLCCGDNYYACLPNLYSIGGGQYRDVSGWIDSLNMMLVYPAEYVLPGHTKALIGREQVQEVLSNYRDALECILTETLKGMNRGLSVDALATAVKLPAELAELPYLGEFYGTVGWAVRSIYNAYLGWFDGNPTNLNRMAPREHAVRMLDLIGSSEKALAEVRRALDHQEPQWAVEVCDLLISAERQTREAKQLKAEGLMALSNLETSANGRHYYIAYAKRLLED